MSTDTIGYNRETLLAMLQYRVVDLKFRKADNSLRFMRATLKSDMIPQIHTEESVHHPTDLITVWDVDAEGWRSVRIDRIIDVL